MQLANQYLMGIDIGTLGSKGLITDDKGNIISEHFLEHDIIYPKPGWAEHDPEKHWWKEFCEIVKMLLKKSKIEPENIAGISVSGLFPNMCPVDKEGNPVRNAILYSDNRAIEEIEFINMSLGTSLTSEDVTPKILWFKKNEPEKFEKTQKILGTQGYIVYKLTGKYAIDYPSALIFGGIFDLEQLKWRDEVCEQIGIPVDVLPTPYPASKVIGEVTEDAAEVTGLAKNTPVIVGSGDTYLSMLGAGVIEQGDAMAYYGTAGLLIICNCSLQEFMSSMKIDSKKEPIILSTYILTTGGLLKWFRDQFAPYEFEIEKKLGVSSYHILDDQANNIPPGSDGLIVIPYFMGQRSPTFNPLARGIIFGLTTSHTRIHVYRALLESFGYGIFHGLEKLKEQGESPPKRIVATGGGAKSRLWRQIVTDIINMPQEYIPRADAPYGNAFLAGYGVGLFKDFKTIKEKWLRVEDVTLPRQEVNKKYQKLFEVYRNLHFSLQERYAELAQALY